MINELLDTAIAAAKLAGNILKEGYGTSFNISSKTGRNNLVTEYDLLSEKTIIDFIKSKYPNHRFLAEESGKSGSLDENEVIWVIDPLDGTVNFAHSIPIFCVSIAAQLNGELLVAVVYQPLLEELFYATKGGGAFLNGNKIYISQSNDINTSLLVTGFPYNVNKNPYNSVDIFVKIVLKGIPIRRLGSAALDLAYIACGRFDGFFEVGLHPWDVAAGALLVSEAGGNNTEYNGNEFNIFSKTIVSTNGLIHNQVVEVLSYDE